MLKVDLPPDAEDALLKLAIRERRNPGDQAAVLILKALSTPATVNPRALKAAKSRDAGARVRGSP